MASSLSKLRMGGVRQEADRQLLSAEPQAQALGGHIIAQPDTFSTLHLTSREDSR